MNLSHSLADQFSQINEEVVTFVDNCSAALWQAPCLDDGRTVAVVAHHIASSHALIAPLITMVATQAPIPDWNVEMLHAGNAQHAAEHSNCTQAEVLALLRSNGGEAANTVRNLSTAELGNAVHISLFGATMSTQQVIENVLIGHVAGHFEALKSTTGQ
ncbi:MAG: hypothetical protein R3A44_08680 [Caldilineaceae bacterium]